MDANDLVQTRCSCCDTPLFFPGSVLSKMRLPAVFCRRCWEQYDYKTLRQWFKLDMAIRHLHDLERRMNERARHAG